MWMVNTRIVMIEVLSNLPEPVIGVRVHGTVSADDYDSVLIPTIEKAVEATGPVRLLYVMDCTVADCSLGAVWDDAMLGFQHLRDFERIAIVTEDPLVRGMISALQFAKAALCKCPGYPLNAPEPEIFDGVSSHHLKLLPS